MGVGVWTKGLFETCLRFPGMVLHGARGDVGCGKERVLRCFALTMPPSLPISLSQGLLPCEGVASALLVLAGLRVPKGTDALVDLTTATGEEHKTIPETRRMWWRHSTPRRWSGRQGQGAKGKGDAASTMTPRLRSCGPSSGASTKAATAHTAHTQHTQHAQQEQHAAAAPSSSSSVMGKLTTHERW